MSALRFVHAPSRAEARVAAEDFSVELLDPSGEVVPRSGPAVSLSVDDVHYGAQLGEEAIAPSREGVATFGGIAFDRPARGVRLVAHLGALSAASAPLDVVPTRPVVSDVVAPATIAGCATVTYTLAQAQGLPVDLLVEVDPDGDGPAPFHVAHQGRSDPGQPGIDQIPSRPEGHRGRYAWNSSIDVPSTDADAVLRFSARAGGVTGGAATSAVIPVRNGPRWRRQESNEPGISVLHVSDFDSDGFPDVITAHGSTLTVYEANGAAPLVTELGSLVREFALADLNADGLVDLAVATQTGLVILYQSRAGQPTGPRPQIEGLHALSQVLASDLDRDGLVDLVVVDAASGDVSVFRNRLASGFSWWTSPWTGGGTGRVVAADLAFPALWISRDASPPIEVDVIDGTFSQPHPVASLTGTEIAVADLDHDGWPDIADLGPEGLSIALSRSSTTIGPLVAIQGQHLALADLNRDGWLDAIVADAQGVKVYSGLGRDDSMAFGPATIVTEEEVMSSVSVGDVDRDGRVDIVVASPDAGRFVRFLADQQRPCGSRLAGPRGLAQGFEVRGLVDVNADGKVDLVGTGTSYLGGLGDGSFAAQSHDLPLLAGAPGSKVLDVDGDGAADIVGMVAATAGSVEILFADPLQPATYPVDVHLATLTDVKELALGDVDGDGSLDLVVGSNDQLQVLLADPAHPRQFTALPPFATHLPGCSATEPCLLEVVDLDADHRPELVVQRGAHLAVFPAAPNEPGTFLAPVSTDVGDARQLAVGNVVGGPAQELLMLSSLAQTESPPALVAYGWDGANLDLVWWARPGGRVMAAALAPSDRSKSPRVAIQLLEAISLFAPDQVPAGANVPRDELVFAGIESAADVPNVPLAFFDLDSDGVPDLFDGAWFVPGRADGSFDGGALVATIGKSSGKVAFGHVSGGRELEVMEVTPDLTTYLLYDPFQGAHYAYEPGIPDVDRYWLENANGDRRDDRIYGTTTGGALQLNRFALPGAEQFETTCATSAAPLALRDLDGDGVADLLVVDHDLVEWIPDPSATCSTPRPLYSLMEGTSYVTPVFGAVVDLNRDGRPDVVTVGDSVVVALQVPGSPGIFGPAQTYEVQSDFFRQAVVDAAVADLNRDGSPDLAVAVGESGRIVVLENAVGSSQDLFFATDTGIPAGLMTLGDIDHNGWIDLVVDGEVHLRNGPYPGFFDESYGTLASRRLYVPAQVRGRGTLVDFDDDGNLDYLVVDPYHGLLEVSSE